MEKTRIVNYPKKRNFKKAMVATALGLSLALGTTSVPAFNNMATVEAAKRDKKKPKIKLFGQKKLEVTEGEKVTIPKTTYSDNQTKKKKLKVAVTVKRGNKNYKSIANKIKSATVKNKPVTVTFDEEGTYKITTTVTDLAKNKATAVRTVTVNDKQEVIEEEQVITKQDPEVTTTTEQPKQEEPAKIVTTETPVTEEPKEEEYIISKESLTNENYKNISFDEELHNKILTKVQDIEEKEGEFESDEEIVVENDYSYMIIPTTATKKSLFLDLCGKITVTDKNGNDITDSLIIDESGLVNKKSSDFGLVFLYANDKEGNEYIKMIGFGLMNNTDNDYTNDEKRLYRINENPDIYAQKRITKEKTLVLK